MAGNEEEKKDWRKKETIAFIKMYEGLPELWNIADPKYKNRNKKSQAMDRLCDEFNRSKEEIKRKVRNLRSQFTAELRKLKKKCQESGVDESQVQSEWKYFDHMRFLISVPIPTDKKNVSFSENQDIICEEFEIDMKGTEIPSTPTQTPKKKVEKVNNDSSQVLVAAKVKRSPSKVNTKQINNIIKTDDHGIFGEYVASELRGLSERSSKKLKLMIRKAILEIAEEEFNYEDGFDASFQ